MLNRLASQFQSPAMLLRVGLGLTFLYAGIASLIDPIPWVGYLPAWTSALAPATTLIPIHGIFQAALGFALITGTLLRLTALVATLDLAGILVSYGIDGVTFRDLGLLFATLALFSHSIKSHHRGTNC